MSGRNIIRPEHDPTLRSAEIQFGHKIPLVKTDIGLPVAVGIKPAPTDLPRQIATPKTLYYTLV